MNVIENETLSSEEIAEHEASEGAVVLMAKALMRADGDEGDAHRMLYSGALHEPWGEAWLRYEGAARKIVEVAGVDVVVNLAAAALRVIQEKQT